MNNNYQFSISNFQRGSKLGFLSLFLIFHLSLLIGGTPVASASATNGTISAEEKYAWGENIGWINFSPSQGNVAVTDDGLSGYAWSARYGWINLAPSQSGVANDGEGNLSGQAWGEKLGWIDFDGVSIGTDGSFSGMASGTISGRINFDCTNCGVATDWRPISARATPTPTPTPAPSSDQTAGSVSRSGGSAPRASAVPDPIELYPEPSLPLIEKILGDALTEKVKTTLAIVVPDFIQDRLSGGERLSLDDLRRLLPKDTPLALRRPSGLLGEAPARFALQPLPAETRLLAEKFPQLAETLKDVGISKMSDVDLLQSSKLSLPRFSALAGLAETKVVPGKFALTVGVPVAELSPAHKQKLPTEIVFARAFNESLDLKTDLVFDERGRSKQQISTIVGQTLNLVVKPEAPVRGVKGYIVLSKRPAPKTAMKIPLDSLVASALFTAPKLSYTQEAPIAKESKFVLSEFEYVDPDRDGIYTADVSAPLVAGEYEVITVMDYKDPGMGKKEIRLIAVVDPEGYVFTKSGKYETRISGAVVSLYWLPPSRKATEGQGNQYVLWPAKEYLQENPQVTDSRGTYSFLVPEGLYYLEVKTPGFKTHKGEIFPVAEGNGVHANIELTPTGSWPAWMDWRLAALVLIVSGLASRKLFKTFKFGKTINSIKNNY